MIQLRENHSPVFDEIGKALMLFQSECPTIEKNTKGYGYTYADLAHITSTIKPHLKNAGLSYSQQVFSTQATVGVHTMLIHGASGQFIESTIAANMEENKQKSMSPVQGMGSIITYLRRYSLSAILGIVTDEDTDGAQIQDKKANPAPVKNQKDENITWLSEEQFKKALASDEKGISAVIKLFSTPAKKMKKEYKEQLENKLKEVKK